MCVFFVWLVSDLTSLNQPALLPPKTERVCTGNRHTDQVNDHSDQGVMGGLVSLESFTNRFNNPNPALLGFMVASYDVSASLIVC